MKKLALILVFVFACLASALAQKIDFQEGGVSFSISVYGTLTYSLPAGKQVFNNSLGQPSKIGDVNIFYGSDNKPSKVGTLHIFYSGGKVSKVGGMSIFYDSSGNVSQTVGAVGGSRGTTQSSSSSQSTSPIYISDVTFQDTESDEYKLSSAEKISIDLYVRQKRELEEKYSKLDKNVTIPDGWHEVKVDDGKYIWTKYAYVDNNYITAIKYSEQSIAQWVSVIGVIQRGKGYYKEYKPFLDSYNNKITSTYIGESLQTVYFVDYLESKKVDKIKAMMYMHYISQITFTSKEKKITKGKVEFRVFAKKISDYSSQYCYIGGITSNGSNAKLVAPPDTYDVIFVFIENKKGKSYVKYSIKTTYTITKGEQTINLTL